MTPSAPFQAGLDIGSTTVKFVVAAPSSGDVVFSCYRRHHASVAETLVSILEEAAGLLGETARLGLIVTGSAGLGLAEHLGIPFMQEVIAAASTASHHYPGIRALVDVGGEDAKIMFFDPGRAPDIRMNGSCAGGTGAFIDQIATLLGREVSELDAMAGRSRAVYPIASRCGVFAKTDIQNLLSRQVPPEDIVASSFHAVAQQIVTTLARGREIVPRVLFCGGPMSFIPRLREACMQAMGLSPGDCVVPEQGELVPALGCAIASGEERRFLSVGELSRMVAGLRSSGRTGGGTRVCPPLFDSAESYAKWKERHEGRCIPTVALADSGAVQCHLGIDSGSTTTKIVALDAHGRLIYSFYRHNEGDPLGTVLAGLQLFHDEAERAGRGDLEIVSSSVTGYGEDLIKAAYGLDYGIVETIAHYQAARRLEPGVSFILDIGGQDMKAAFIQNGTIVRLDINEACSSGCGSFIDGFARSLGYGAAEFAALACESTMPCDLGTRCTVFMNSKVKQSLRENAPLPDIAAGLAYSVARNCLYKVLKINNTDELGECIVVQGGTMRNHAVVRAFELLTGRPVVVAPLPELMGAYGAALHSMRMQGNGDGRVAVRLRDLVRPGRYETTRKLCPGCENHCRVNRHVFANGNTFFSGNNCEKVFSNRGVGQSPGRNFHAWKYRRLAALAKRQPESARLNVGMVRALNFYENFPFWHALLTQCGIKVTVSAASTFEMYGKGAGSIMSDNICFPAKLVHGHVHNLVDKGVDRILMPFVVHEQREDGGSANSYNCPVVTGYSDVIRSAMDTGGKYGIPLDSPVLTFRDDGLLKKACRQYLVGDLGTDGAVFARAFDHALAERERFKSELVAKSQSILDLNRNSGRLLIVLVGRPYHIDPLIQHKVSDMIAAFGADVLSEDAARSETGETQSGTVEQWTYPTRMIKAANLVARAPSHVHLVQLTSFGCGPDAFVVDAVGDILKRAGKSHTVLKVDDVNNPGSLRLRIRSLIDSLSHRRDGSRDGGASGEPVSPPAFTKEHAGRTILLPFFSEIYSPLLPAFFNLMGYRTENLPPSGAESVEYGLQYANNEVCYPATLVVGDVIHALKSGRYDHGSIALAITQTGGQCRASNYIALIKKALVRAGFHDIPVVSVGTNAHAVNNSQPGFRLKLKGNIRSLTGAILYADRIAGMYYASAVREREPGSAKRLRDRFIARGVSELGRRNVDGMLELLRRAAVEFNALIDPDAIRPRIGVVGEIYVKYNSTGNRNIVDWLISQGVEPVVPSLLDFFLQEFPNRRFNRSHYLSRSGLLSLADPVAYWWVQRQQKAFDAAASGFLPAGPAEDIFTKSRSASRIINLAAQYGEGWLIPAELAGFAERGILHAVSLQPFGCIANHLVAKGIEKRVCDLYPGMSLLFLDLDSGSSEANMFNRLHFMVRSAKESVRRGAAAGLRDT